MFCAPGLVRFNGVHAQSDECVGRTCVCSLLLARSYVAFVKGRTVFSSRVSNVCLAIAWWGFGVSGEREGGGGAVIPETFCVLFHLQGFQLCVYIVGSSSGVHY
jgi:hypothetical protein